MEETIEVIRRKITPILRRHDVARAAIFGSFAREEPRADSDLDILVEFSGDKTLLDLVGLQLTLEKTLQREVDVLTYQSLHPRIRERVLREQVVLL